ncbi:MAG TPA: Lar family restriction alleviation protein [Rhizomicrobium sp.]|nr:Lar family restriction alleviation protein [Rhizomicrobium sp.]
MNMLEVIRQGAGARPAEPRHLPCPFCGADPPLATQIAGRFLIGCENDDCAANPQVCGASIAQAWERWNSRAGR